MKGSTPTLEFLSSTLHNHSAWEGVDASPGEVSGGGVSSGGGVGEGMVDSTGG